MTRRYAVIGDPVSHSLSPLMHNAWIADHGFDASYEAVQLRSDDPVGAIRGLTRFAGMNVTAPHKEAAAMAADDASPPVAAINAANTLTWRDGWLRADNTDIEGFARALNEAAPEWRGAASALVVGAGGAGRGVAFAMAGQDGPQITIVNRTRERAQDAVRLIEPYCGQRVRARPWADLPACMAEADIIVNTTTLGVAGGPLFAWPIGAAPANAVVADIVYRPLETGLLRAARARGLRTVDGLGMLIHQGALAFELWFGVKPDTKRARQLLIAALA
jgi:shikimate dehydrogenase